MGVVAGETLTMTGKDELNEEFDEMKIDLDLFTQEDVRERLENIQNKNI